MKFVIYPTLDEEGLAEVQAAAPQVEVLNVADEDEALEVIGDAEAMYGRITPALLRKAQPLSWVQDRGVGPQENTFPELVESDITLTTMRGIWSDYIADHAMAFVLMLARGMHLYLRRQSEGRWDREPAPVVHLADQTLGIIGLGGIGAEVARRAAACQMRVIAVDVRKRERPAFVSELWGLERLPDLLAESGFVVVCVPHTPETVRLISTRQLELMKESAYLINVTRGVVVDLDALTKALQRGEIAGAGMDVFEIEPLPSGHPLWAMENVIITPHRAGVGLHGRERQLQVVKENLRRFVAGEPLMNVVDKRRWF